MLAKLLRNKSLIISVGKGKEDISAGLELNEYVKLQLKVDSCHLNSYNH